MADAWFVIVMRALAFELSNPNRSGVDRALYSRKAQELTTGSAPYLQSSIATIEVNDGQVCIRGSKDLLEKTVAYEPKRTVLCSQTSTRGAPEEISNS